MKVIFSCECGNTSAFAADAYSLLFPDTPIPEIAKGDAKIRQVATRFNSDSEAYQHISGIARSKEKFAIYLDLSDDGRIAEAYNLLTGNRIQ